MGKKAHGAFSGRSYAINRHSHSRSLIIESWSASTYKSVQGGGSFDTVVPAAHMEIIESPKTAFTTLCEAMKLICIVYGKHIWRLIELHAKKMGDSVLGNVNIEILFGLYNVRRKARRQAPNISYLPARISEISSRFAWRVVFWALGHTFCVWLQFRG